MDGGRSSGEFGAEQGHHEKHKVRRTCNNGGNGYPKEDPWAKRLLKCIYRGSPPIHT